MVIEETGIKFQFAKECTAVKFDDTEFFREYYNYPGAKGVDILADARDMMQFIEVKNCYGHERENLWRITPNNRRNTKIDDDTDVNDRDSLDIEVVKKVASTISCIVGAQTKAEKTSKAEALKVYCEGITESRVAKDKKQLNVVLFLEGDFDKCGPKSRTKKMIMKSLQDSMNDKLEWLQCKVSVVDSSTYSPKCFEIV